MLELDKLSESLHQWHQELQETASQQAVEGERKSLARQESLTTTMEQALACQRECLKKMKESEAQKEASLQEKARQLEAALDAQVQEVVRETVRNYRRTSAWGPSKSSTGRAKQAQLWCHLE